MSNIDIVKSTQDTSSVPVFLEILERIQRGATINVDEAPSNLYTLFAGCPLATTSTQGIYAFMKSAVVATAKADGATRIVIDKQMFKVGEFIGIDEAGAGTTATVTVAAAGYLVTGETNYTLTKKQIVYQVNAAAATAPKYRPYALLENTVRIRNSDGTTLKNITGSAVVRGSVAISNYPYGYTLDIKNRLESRLRFVLDING